MANMTEAQRRGGYYGYGGLPTHEFSVYGTGGLSSLKYKLSGGGTASSGAGGSGGIGYTFNVNDNWGIVTGVEVGIYAGKAAYAVPLSGEHEYGTAGTPEHFTFKYSAEGYGERQKATLVSVPLMAQFKTPLGGESAHFYLSGGFKFGFPASAKATVIPGTLTTSGRFSYEQIEYRNIEEYGFVSAQPVEQKTADIDLGFSAALSLETGVRFSLGGSAALYTGAFLNYGLNSIRPADGRRVIDYRNGPPSTFGYNSILNSSLTDKVNIFGAGLKIRLSFGW
jgi:hypothetical protein